MKTILRSAPLMAWLVLGCAASAPQGEVEGRLTIAGKPVANVQVQFVPDESMSGDVQRATAITDSDGRYVLKQDSLKPGVCVGTYRVILVDLSTLPDENEDVRSGTQKPPAKNAKKVSIIPKEFTELEWTPLRKEVAPGKQTIDLTI